MDQTQKDKLAELFAQEHVAVIVTQGDEWPTATFQAFAETPDFDLLFIMGDTRREVSESAQAVQGDGDRG